MKIRWLLPVTLVAGAGAVLLPIGVQPAKAAPLDHGGVSFSLNIGGYYGGHDSIWDEDCSRIDLEIDIWTRNHQYEEERDYDRYCRDHDNFLRHIEQEREAAERRCEARLYSSRRNYDSGGGYYSGGYYNGNSGRNRNYNYGGGSGRSYNYGGGSGRSYNYGSGSGRNNSYGGGSRRGRNNNSTGGQDRGGGNNRGRGGRNRGN